MSLQTRYKSRILAVLMMVFALWASTAIADVNEDFRNAAYCGDLLAVKNGIAKGADVNAKNEKGATALMAASQRGYKDVVQLLKKAGAVESEQP